MSIVYQHWRHLTKFNQINPCGVGFTFRPFHFLRACLRKCDVSLPIPFGYTVMMLYYVC